MVRLGLQARACPGVSVVVFRSSSSLLFAAADAAAAVVSGAGTWCSLCQQQQHGSCLSVVTWLVRECCVVAFFGLFLLFVLLFALPRFADEVASLSQSTMPSSDRETNWLGEPLPSSAVALPVARRQLPCCPQLRCVALRCVALAL